MPPLILDPPVIASSSNCYSSSSVTWYILSPGPRVPRGFGPPLRSGEGASRGDASLRTTENFSDFLGGTR